MKKIFFLCSFVFTLTNSVNAQENTENKKNKEVPTAKIAYEGMSFSTVIFSDQIEAKLLRYRISKINEYPIKSDERIILKNNNGQIVEGIFKEIDINQNIIIFDLKKEKTSILPLKDFRNYYK